KADPEDILIKLSIRNAGPEAAELDVIPTLWFRNTWAWGLDDRVPSIRAENGGLVAEHHELGRRTLMCDGSPDLLFCDNETNTQRLWGLEGRSRFPKDGINDHIVNGAATVNPDKQGTKAAFRHHVSVGPGQTVAIRLRLSPDGKAGEDFDPIMGAREKEANEFYAELTPAAASPDEAMVLREAL